MLDQVEKVFDDKKKMLSKVNKNTYPVRVDAFIETHGHFIREMFDYMDESENAHRAAKELSDCFAEKVYQANLSGRKKKMDGGVQTDLSMFMIYYVFPAILKTEDENAVLLADTLCRSWNAQFKGASITYTDYDYIYGGFQDNIFSGFLSGLKNLR